MYKFIPVDYILIFACFHEGLKRYISLLLLLVQV